MKPGTAEQAVIELGEALAVVYAAIGRAELQQDVAERLKAEAETFTDVLALDTWLFADPEAKNLDICRYPLCFLPRKPRKKGAKGGEPPAYCAHGRDEKGREHTAQMSRRRRTALKTGVDADEDGSAGASPAAARPVTYARASVLEQVAALRQDLARVSSQLGRLDQTIEVLGDEEAQAAEIEAVHNKAHQAEEKARGLVLEAERRERLARQAAEAALASRDEANNAAEEAEELAEQRRLKAAEATAGKEAAEAAAIHAKAEAAERVEQARQEAQAAIAQAQKDADAQIARIKAEAEAVVQQAERERDQAQESAAEREREAHADVQRAEQSASEARAAADEAKAQAAQLREQHEAAITALHQTYREQLTSLRDKHEAAQVTLRDAHQEKIEELQRKADERQQQDAAEVRRLNELARQAAEDHAGELQRLRTEHAATLTAQLAAQQKRADAERERQLADLRQAHATELGLQAQVIEALTERAARAEAEADRMRGEGSSGDE